MRSGKRGREDHVSCRLAKKVAMVTCIEVVINQQPYSRDCQTTPIHNKRRPPTPTILPYLYWCDTDIGISSQGVSTLTHCSYS